MHRITTALCLVALPLTAAAQDAGGTLTGTLNRDDANWTILRGENDRGSAWSDTGEGYEVRIVAQPSDAVSASR